MWGGKGAPAAGRCVICGKQFGQDEVRWEAEFESRPESARHEFHIPCYSAFNTERKYLQPRESSALGEANESARRSRPLKASGDGDEET